MTPDNDKTLRGIFRPVKHGFDEWNDRRDYRLKYEKQYDIGQIRRSALVQNILENIYSPSIIHDSDDEMDQISILEKYFPETKKAKEFIYYSTFGYGVSEDGEYNKCDRCGVNLHALNTFKCSFGLCEICDFEISKRETNPLSDDYSASTSANVIEGEFID